MTTASAVVAKSVAADYVHIDKYVTPDKSITLGTSELKWYDIAPKDSPVLAEIKSLALGLLGDESADGNLSELGDLGFLGLLIFLAILANTFIAGFKIRQEVARRGPHL